MTVAFGSRSRRLSIVIPVHNRVDLAIRLLTSIGRFGSSSAEVIVVDDASELHASHHLRDRLSQHFTNAHLLRNSDNQGFAESVNRGVDAASGSTVIVINSDCVVTPGFDERPTTMLDSNPAVGAVTAVTNGGNFTRVCWSLPVGHNILSISSRIAQVGLAEPRPLSVFDGFFFAFRKSDFRAVGGLSGEYGRGYFEDVDFGFKLQRAGLSTVICERQFIFHQGSQSFAVEDKRRLMTHNRQVLEEKWGLSFEAVRNEQILNYPVSYADSDFLSRKTDYPKRLVLD